MKLYIMRHGQAVAESLDPTCPLTEKGKGDVLKVARFLKSRQAKIPLIWHSPKRRAHQTAHLIAGEIPQPEIIQKDHLSPNDEPRQIIEEIEAVTLDLLIVTHMPFIGRLTSLLLNGRENDFLKFEPAGLALLESTDKIRWFLKAFIAPEEL